MARYQLAALAALFTALLLAYLVPLPAIETMSAPLLLTRIANRARPAAAALVQKSLTSPLGSTIRPSAFTTTPKLPSSNSNFSSTTSNMADSTNFIQAVQNRRTIYQLNKKSPVPDSKIEELARIAIKDVPSSFNSQSARMIVLLKDQHDKFWDTTKDILKAIVPADSWSHTEQRINGFRAGYGTILFYEDPNPVKALQSKFPMYSDKFPTWSEHTSAMHQYMMWTALEAEGFGCNLQHYNPLPDQKAAEIWDIPLEWQHTAQLVFGGVEPGARENLPTKSEEPIEKRLFIHGKE